MPQGTLEVFLVSAKGLENTDFLRNMDPYVLLTCRTQEKKSSIASGKGSDPEWNENFVFTVSEGVSELRLKIMDSDWGSQDDFVGEATIPLVPVFLERSLPPTAYNVVKNGEYHGEIKIGITFKRNTIPGIFKLKNLLEGGSCLHTMTRPIAVSILISVSRTCSEV